MALPHEFLCRRQPVGTILHGKSVSLTEVLGIPTPVSIDIYRLSRKVTKVQALDPRQGGWSCV